MIEIKNLSKQFGNTDAIKDVSFSFDGKVLGVCGIGKTVLLNAIGGVIPCTNGEILISEEEGSSSSALTKDSVGCLLEDAPMPSEMTPVEFLNFIGKAKGVSNQKLSKQINTVLDITNLKDLKSVYINHLSIFERKLLGVAQTLLGNPTAIILDEPFSALTKHEKRHMRQLIKTIGEIKPVIVSAQNISELSEICDKIAYLEDAELLAYGTLDELLPILSSKDDDEEDAEYDEDEYNNEEISESEEEEDAE